MRLTTPTVAATAAVLALAALAAGWWFWWRPAPPAPPPIVAAPAVEPAPAAPAPVPALAAEPRHPIAEPEPTANADRATRPVDMAGGVAALVGQRALQALLQTDDFVPRIVATVDNLARPAAPARLWPVVPAEGRFLVAQEADGGALIGADNAARYERYVALAERLDPAAVARLYRSAYPQFRAAYASLGFAGARFNDRVVEVIDLLLATPDVAPPVAVRLPVIGGPVQPQRPWLLYEYADPGLQERAIGQRVLMRLSPGQQQRARAWLAAFRQQIATP
jgi:hypothetical protein